MPRTPTKPEDEVIQLRAFLLVLLVLALAGCSSGVPTTRDPMSGVPSAPSPPNASRFNTGSPDERPTVQQFLITNAGEQNGWRIVPAEGFSLVLEAGESDKVTFYAYVPGEEELDPERNGVLAEGSRASDQNSLRWVARRETPGGKQLAVYAVAENQHGRTVGPVVFVVLATGLDQAKIKAP